MKLLILGADAPKDYMAAGPGLFSGRIYLGLLRVIWSCLVMSLNYFK